MKSTPPLVSPVAPSERIKSLDVLRGFAVLGILIMNIQSYAMIEAAYFNPTMWGDLTGLNLWVWILSHIFGDQKFMTIFSILFGAGIILISTKAESKGLRAAGLHYRRTLWLFVIGAIHAYVFWHGDILVIYALCSITVFLFRKLSPRKLLILGLVSISICSMIYLFMGATLPSWPSEAQENASQFYSPDADSIEHEIEAYQGGWLQQMSQRVPSSLLFHTFVFLMWAGWRAGGLMLVGMALFKWGVLTAKKSNRFYRNMALLGLGVGLPVVSFGVIQGFAHGWSFENYMATGFQFNYWGSIPVSLAFIGLILLLSKNPKFDRFTSPFAAVGRMALTNYLFHTIVFTSIFYGHGLGLYGKVDRTGQILMILGMWSLQLVLSPIWLRHFRFGPAEWLWRSLTYGKMQPMRIRN